MALRHSTEKILGWRTQYAAMLRWHKRCEACHNGQCYTSGVDALDFMLAFFVVCYHLRDYAIETGKISQREIDRLIGTSRYMRVCRDVCNRSKHHTLTGKASTDRDWSIGREYMPFSDGDEKLVLIADEKYDVIDVVRGCVQFWNDVVSNRLLEEPPNPFRSDRGAT